MTISKYARQIASFLIVLVLPFISANAAEVHVLNSSSVNFKLHGANTDGIGYFTMDHPIERDINGNGKLDFILTAQNANNNGSARSGSVYIILDSIIESYAKGADIDLADSANYSWRIDGPLTDSMIRGSAYDFNGDNNSDILIAPYGTSYGATNGGSLYIIYYDKLLSFTTKNVQLTATDNYSLRIDGSYAGGYFANIDAIADDVDGDGKDDLFVTSHHAGYNGADSGSAFLFYGSLLESKSGTIALSTSSNYSIRFDGPTTSVTISGGDIGIGDITGDGEKDLIIATDYSNYNSRTRSGSIWVFDQDDLPDASLTGQNIVITQDSTSENNNWIYRIDGARAQDRLSYSNMQIDDLDQDGKQDILAGTLLTDYDGTLTGVTRTDSGSLYVILGKDLAPTASHGNLYDLADPNDFFARVDGAAAGDYLAYLGNYSSGDVDNDGIVDVLVGSLLAPNGFSGAGSMYVLLGSHLDYDQVTRGTIIDLSDTSNYSLRYDGESTNQRVWAGGPKMVDINGDGSTDLAIAAYGHDSYSSTNNGALYIIYGFPHEISSDENVAYSSSTITLTGTIDASDSVSNISNVHYQLDSNSISGTWIPCSADDGSFNSTQENFTCTVVVSGKERHDVYIRVVDTNGIYTSRSNYKHIELTYKQHDQSCEDNKPNGTPDIYKTIPHNNSIEINYTTDATPKEYFQLRSKVQNSDIYTYKEIRKFSSGRYELKDLEEDTEYEIAMRAINGCKEGNWSNAKSVRTTSTDRAVTITNPTQPLPNSGTSAVPLNPQSDLPADGGITETAVIKELPTLDPTPKDSTDKRNKTIIPITAFPKVSAILLIAGVLGTIAQGAAKIAVMAKAQSFQLLASGFIRRTKNPWGVVYDSQTKQPLDPAIITLTNSEGKTFQAVTDMYGRYAFVVSPGIYQITAQKTDYEFPSKKIKSQVNELVYPDVLTETTVTVNKSSIVNLNIPMDSTKANWNQQEKLKMGITGPSPILATLTTVSFYVGILWSGIALLLNFNLTNITIVMLFALILIEQKRQENLNKWGEIKNKTGKGLPGCIVTLINVNHPKIGQRVAVTNELGRFNFLVQQGVYKLLVEKLEGDKRSIVFESKGIEIKKKLGCIAKNITLNT